MEITIIQPLRSFRGYPEALPSGQAEIQRVAIDVTAEAAVGMKKELLVPIAGQRKL